MRPVGGENSSTLSLLAEPAAVASAREFVRRSLSGAVPTAVSSDLQLIASELFTNAIQHGENERVGITVDRDAGFAGVTVESRGPAPNVETPAEWSVAEPESLNGRGLGIVRKLADEVFVDRSDGRLVVTARQALERHADA